MTFRPTGQAAGFELVQFKDGEDFVMRPLIRGLCRYESTKDGALDMADFARMNDALDISDENERRMAAAEEKK